MEFNYKFSKSSQIDNTNSQTNMAFAPDLERDPTFFVGKLNKKIPFREAISALHDVVVSDLRYKPKDRTAYKEWVVEQEKLWLSDFMAEYQIEEIRKNIKQVKHRLSEIYKDRDRLLGPFNKAKQQYFEYLYRNDKDAWFVLDPVITVHPDEVFFECFSQDESSYGKLSANYNVFDDIEDFKCGTTNIDYSENLYHEFQKIRDYKETIFKIDPSGFEAQTTNENVFKEMKIDLPDSWVRGFLQVSAAMTLPTTSFYLHPMDIHGICQYLRRFRETKGPRAMRFVLEPGQPIQVVFEPWFETITFHRSVYQGDTSKTIRIWGRRRLHILERLIPIAKRFKVSLMGNGLPSFFMADLGDMTFTLGLSGWTNNDWSKAGNFDLMAPRGHVSANIRNTVFESLKQNWFATTTDLAKHLQLESATVAAALTAYTQAGRVMYDMNLGVYRLRELTQEPLNFEHFRFASEQEQKANHIIENETIKVSKNIKNDELELQGVIKIKNYTYKVNAVIDKDQRLISGECQCHFYMNNGLKKGPCEHLIAVRMAAQQPLTF